MPLFWPAETLENKTKNPWGTRIHNYIEVFYILRILRIFTLVPKYSGLRVLLLTLKNSIGELILYMMMLFMTIMIFASFIFYAEQIFEVIIFFHFSTFALIYSNLKSQIKMLNSKRKETFYILF